MRNSVQHEILQLPAANSFPCHRGSKTKRGTHIQRGRERVGGEISNFLDMLKKWSFYTGM